MAVRGLEISGDRPGNVWDHWYYYTFRGNMAVYRAILRHPQNWRIPDLRARPGSDHASPSGTLVATASRTPALHPL